MIDSDTYRRFINSKDFRINHCLPIYDYDYAMSFIKEMDLYARFPGFTVLFADGCQIEWHKNGYDVEINLYDDEITIWYNPIYPDDDSIYHLTIVDWHESKLEAINLLNVVLNGTKDEFDQISHIRD